VRLPHGTRLVVARGRACMVVPGNPVNGWAKKFEPAFISVS